jgi:hypothetical protein
LCYDHCTLRHIALWSRELGGRGEPFLSQVKETLMKFAMIAGFIVLLATSAIAADPAGERFDGQLDDLDVPGFDREIFYVQEPHSLFLKTNASTPYDSEAADDIPVDLDGMFFGQIEVYIGEWGADWVDPLGVFVNLYNGTCPPDMEPYATMYFDWGDPDQMTYEFVAGGLPNSHQALVTLFLPEMVEISAPTSIGFVVDNDWGTNPPWCGLVKCDESEGIYGACLGYVDHDYWGVPRWTEDADIAFGLDDEFVVSTESSSWARVKALYR